MSRRVTQEMLDQALLVLCMTESHRDMIEISANPVPGRLYLFREFTGDPLGREIPDPYGMHLSAYEACRDELVDAIPSIVKFLSELPAGALRAARATRAYPRADTKKFCLRRRLRERCLFPLCSTPRL